MRTNRHHLFWPRKHYRSGLEKRFRNLPCNVIRIDIYVHNMIHYLQPPPRMPSVKTMQDAIGRHKNETCGCYGR